MFALRIIIIILGLYLIYRYVVKNVLEAYIDEEKEKIIRAEEASLDINEFNKKHKTKIKDNKNINKFLEK